MHSGQSPWVLPCIAAQLCLRLQVRTGVGKYLPALPGPSKSALPAAGGASGSSSAAVGQDTEAGGGATAAAAPAAKRKTVAPAMNFDAW